MQRFKTEAVDLLNIFYKTAGLGVLYLDAGLEPVACVPEACPLLDPDFLSTARIMDFLKEIYAKAAEGNNASHQYYTFISEYNFFSDVVVLYEDGGILGALITEPVLVKKLDYPEMRKLLAAVPPLPGGRASREEIFLKAPVIPYDRLMPLGRTLYGLARTLFPGEAPRQVLRRGKPAAPSPAARRRGRKEPAELPSPAKHSPYPIFLEIKRLIQSGDSTSLLRTMGEISAGDIPMDQLNRGDFVRSVKDSAIKSCALGCYAAIEGRAPYERVMDRLDDCIRRIEALSNIYDIYELMKHAMLSFARTVAAGGSLYTKPVVQAMEYIEKHYAEQITLKDLAEYTGLSTFYLSSLIRKETGQTLSDNINRVRVEKSKPLLFDRNRSVLEAARLSGFSRQNYFTAVFKRFTGLTPGNFRKNLGLFPPSSTAAGKGSGLLPAVYEQVGEMLRSFPGMADAARIVDPASRRCWLVDGPEVPDCPDTCYRFWQRGTFCDNCVSQTAALLDDAFFKMESLGKTTFLVMAIPRHAGKETCVVELLKKLPEKRPAQKDAEPRKEKSDLPL